MKNSRSDKLILLVVLQGAAGVWLYSCYLQLHPDNSATPERRVHVLLLSSWRSGSSFLGQVFGQHPSVFYLMEPGWHVWNKMPNFDTQFLQIALRDLLQKLYRCDLSEMSAYLPENHRVSSLFMWTESRALCSAPACSVTATNKDQCLQRCGVHGLPKVEEACASYSHVVLKETRFFELESLFPLLQDPNLDLRIVHLVRDPRAVLRSREESAKSFKADNAVVLEQRKVPAARVQYEVMRKVCQSHIRIGKTALLNPPPFLEGRYKLVRYEDVARNPLKQVEDIYEFVGLKMTGQMRDWVYRKTHGRGKGDMKNAFEITSRNATQVSEAWRTMLPHSKVRRVQEVCEEAMSLLGYTTVKSEKQQKTLDIDLLFPSERHQL
nr:carbohydrate sulfotransferase 5-like [Nothobranchius furzeri]